VQTGPNHYLDATVYASALVDDEWGGGIRFLRSRQKVVPLYVSTSSNGASGQGEGSYAGPRRLTDADNAHAPLYRRDNNSHPALGGRVLNPNFRGYNR